MSEIKIERGVPIPENRNNSKYPWREMQVGDSFLFPEGKAFADNAARAASQRTGKKFIVKKQGGTFRCWRVA